MNMREVLVFSIAASVVLVIIVRLLGVPIDRFITRHTPKWPYELQQLLIAAVVLVGIAGPLVGLAVWLGTKLLW